MVFVSWMKMIAAQSSSAILEKKKYFSWNLLLSKTQFMYFSAWVFTWKWWWKHKNIFLSKHFFFREINHFFESNLFPNYTFLCENDCKTFFSYIRIFPWNQWQYEYIFNLRTNLISRYIFNWESRSETIAIGMYIHCKLFWRNIFLILQ